MLQDVLRQADTLFLRGEYEQALVWYHRGRRLRSKAREFQNGIAKCERAINNRCSVCKCERAINNRCSVCKCERAINNRCSVCKCERAINNRCSVCK